MTYDEDLADRVRIVLQDRSDVVEKKMFGGLAFLVAGHLAVSARRNGGLMVRCDHSDTDRLMADSGVEQMIMKGRPLDGWLRIDSAPLNDDALAHWISIGTSFTESLPPRN